MERIEAKRKRSDASESGAPEDADQTSEQSFASAIQSVLQLPDACLSRAFSFLPFGERVTFAMSSPAWNSEQKQDWAKLIIGATPVHEIDFGDCRFAAKLTDADVDCILGSVDATNNLEELKLTNCIGVVGHGLQSLRGSTVLKKIDLSLFGRYENAANGLDGLISIEAVVPILLSILEGQKCSLKYVQLPFRWRHNSTNVRLERFIERYNRVLVKCDCCNSTVEGKRVGDYRTCYECNRHYCEKCDYLGEEDLHYFTHVCDNCEKPTCRDCVPVRKCHFCGDNTICMGCRPLLSIECSQGCNECWYCIDCYENETVLCDKCKKRGCECMMTHCEVCAVEICYACVPRPCDECSNRGLVKIVQSWRFVVNATLQDV